MRRSSIYEMNLFFVFFHLTIHENWKNSFQFFDKSLCKGFDDFFKKYLVTCVGLICVNRITIQGVQNGGGGLERFVEPKGRTSNLLEPPIFFQNRTSNSSNLPKKVEPQAANLVRPNTNYNSLLTFRNFFNNF